MKTSDLLPFWLDEALTRARASERRARKAFEALKDKGTEYARAIEGIADAHGEAVAVYARRLDAAKASREKATP